MGKAKKNKMTQGAGRFDPYKRETTRITDLCDMFSAATANTIKEGVSMEDEHDMQADRPELEAEGSGDDGDDEHSGEETRGRVLQRHKKEWKSLRSRLNDMKAHKKAMGHGTLSKKYEKKDLAKEIKSMEELMRIRHDKELAEFDQKHKETVAPRYCPHNRERSMCKACRKSSARGARPREAGCSMKII